ncbi:hypothetical protein ACB098_05G055100 [Castanea mollissima]
MPTWQLASTLTLNRIGSNSLLTTRVATETNQPVEVVCNMPPLTTKTTLTPSKFQIPFPNKPLSLPRENNIPSLSLSVLHSHSLPLLPPPTNNLTPHHTQRHILHRHCHCHHHILHQISINIQFMIISTL